MTRNSCTAFCGNGLPRLESWPTAPPCSMSFLKLTPSMKTLVCSDGWASAAIVFRSGSLDSRTPGARAAKFRKLRLSWGRFSICCVVTLVAASEVLVSTSCVPVTVIDSETAAAWESEKSRSTFCPTRTRARWAVGSNPVEVTVRVYSPGVRPPSWKDPSALDVMVLTNPEAVPTASILALPSAAPLSSVTLPRMVAVVVWATAATARMPASSTNRADCKALLMEPLLFFGFQALRDGGRSHGRRAPWRCSRAAVPELPDARWRRAGGPGHGARDRRCRHEWW